MSYETTAEQLHSQFNSAIADAEDLVKATANSADEKITRLRAKAEESLKNVKASVTGTQDSVRLRAMYAADAVDARVHERPWESMGVVAVAALAVGFFAGFACARD